MKKYALILFTTGILNLAGGFSFAETGHALYKKEYVFPVSYICESLGGKVSWNPKQRTVSVNYSSRSMELKIGSKTIKSNGKQKILADEVGISGGRTILPVSVLEEELGIRLSEQEYLSIVAKRFIKLMKSNGSEEAGALLSTIFSNYLTSGSLDKLANSVSELRLDSENTQYWQNSVHKIIGIPLSDKQHTFYAIKFDCEGKIDELGILGKQPEAAPAPAYASEGAFTESEVTIGKGVWKLPGTLSMPKGNGPFPAVILVQDAGAYDRDETTGYIKPFRDIAQGLAANKIAVLRYDKRSLVHSTKFKLIGNATLNEETEQDVFAAAEYLKTAEGIDKSRIIVLGHSLGGYALPGILTTGGDSFKAGIIMNGFTRPQYELFPEYLEYLQKKGMASSNQVEYIKKQVAFLSSPDFNPKNPPGGYTMGNEHYYGYMKSYSPKALAEKLNKPVLVMQGQRDIIVNTEIDFVNWKEALRQNSKAEFRLYTKLNHMFTEGEGDSTPREYYNITNIPLYVIDDIVNFINKLE